MLVGVWKNVQNEGGRILEVEFGTLAQFDDFIHQLPRLLNGLPVDLAPGRGHAGREGPVQAREQVGEVPTRPRRRHISANFRFQQPPVPVCVELLLLLTVFLLQPAQSRGEIQG